MIIRIESQAQLDTLLSNIANLRELYQKQDQLLEEMAVTLILQYLWPEWGDAKRKSVQLRLLPQFMHTTYGFAAASVRARTELVMSYTPETPADRIYAKLTDDPCIRTFPAADIPDLLFTHMLAKARKAEK